jgi:hypothetical protein
MMDNKVLCFGPVSRGDLVSMLDIVYPDEGLDRNGYVISHYWNPCFVTCWLDNVYYCLRHGRKMS